MDKNFEKKLEKVKKRKSWPATLLANILGKPRKYIYRKVDNGTFDVINDGGYMKISSDSVIKYFLEKHHQKV